MSHERFRYQDRRALERKIAELQLELPLADDISVLFSPLEVAGKNLPNRFAAHPLEGADSEPSGGPSDLTFRRYRRLARSGCGLIWFEATAVTEEGRSNPRQLMIVKESKDGFKRLAEETRREAQKKLGPDHAPLLILQLTHSGRFSKPQGKPRPIIAQHNPILDAKMGLPADYPLITDGELGDLKEIFFSAAEIAREAGFDGVDIKACHGYLVSELLASFTRQDSLYGGTFENRTRLLIETSEKIAEGVKGPFVTCRLNIFDSLPWPYGFGASPQEPETEDLTETKALLNKFARLGFPLVNLSAGVPRHKPHIGRPFDIPLLGMAPPEEHPLVGVSRLLRLTGDLQKSFPALLMVGTGYSWLRHFFPSVAAAMVQTGKVAMIGLGRAVLAYPEFLDDLMENGVLNPRKVCTACSRCSQLLRDGGRVGCTVRDAKIYAPEYRKIKKKILGGDKIVKEGKTRREITPAR
jgi:2,4-dienoyl-CoA reductase-like NADH-dependent reductase (Old Yellow Enzyme family)